MLTYLLCLEDLQTDEKKDPGELKDEKLWKEKLKHKETFYGWKSYTTPFFIHNIARRYTTVNRL